MPATDHQAGRCGHRAHETVGFCSSWPPSIVCAGVLVIFPRVLLAFRHAPSLTSSLNLVEVETLPSWQVLLSCLSMVLWPPPTSHLTSRWTSLPQLIPTVTAVLFHRPDETSPVPSPAFATSRSPYAGGFFTAAFPGSSPLLLPSPCVTGSAPSCSPCGANMSALQVSLYVTGCCFALPSQEVTTLQRLLTTGCLLRGLLTVTTTGLAPVSRR